MTFDIHPIIVHFPIALLFLYSLLVIVPVDRWVPTIPWKYIRNFLLFIGVIGSILASSTGEIAEEINQVNRDVLELHETFAGTTQALYGILIGSVVINFLEVRIPRLRQYTLTRLVLRIVRIIDIKWVTVLLAIAGLVTLTLTGVFGGVLVYGTTADPLAAPLLTLFGVTI